MRRHSTDAVSLGFGILFLAIAAWWAIDRYLAIDLDIPHLGWIAAAALILLGLIGVIASLQGDRAAREEPRTTDFTAPETGAGPAATTGTAEPAGSGTLESGGTAETGTFESGTAETGTGTFGAFGADEVATGELGPKLDDTAQQAGAPTDPDSTPVDDEPSGDDSR